MRKLLNYTAELPQELRQADQMLTAYGRWAKDRQKVHRCGSAEGRFRPPPDESVEEDSRRMAREAILSTPDALKIARALVRVPEQERIILQTLYVPQRLPAHRILQIKRVPPRMCQERHLAGVRMFANILRTLQ